MGRLRVRIQGQPVDVEGNGTYRVEGDELWLPDDAHTERLRRGGHVVVLEHERRAKVEALLNYVATSDDEIAMPESLAEEDA